MQNDACNILFGHTALLQILFKLLVVLALELVAETHHIALAALNEFDVLIWACGCCIIQWCILVIVVVVFGVWRASDIILHKVEASQHAVRVFAVHVVRY